MTAKTALDLSSVRIKQLDHKDCLSRFQCGVHEIDDWAKDKAHKFHTQRRMRIFTAHLPGNSSAAGFYALSMRLEPPSKLFSQEHRDRFVDGAHIAYIWYLGVDRPLQEQRLGTFLMMDSLTKVRKAAEILPIYGLGLRSRTPETTKFYENLGFSVAPGETDSPLMLLPIWTLLDLI